MPPNSDRATRFPSLEHLTWARFDAGHARYLLSSSQIPVPPAEILDASGPLPLVLSPELRSAFIEGLAARYGVAHDEVTLTAGVSEALVVACAGLLEPGDWALVETPAYQSLGGVPAACGAVVRRVERGLDGAWAPAEAGRAVRETAAAARRSGQRLALVVVSDLHNPTGAALGGETLEALVGGCEAAGARLLLDEVYRDADETRSIGTARNRHPGVVVVSSLTKVYGLGGLRTGWILSPAGDAAVFRRVQNYYSVIPAAPSVHLAIRALERADEILAWGRAMTRANRAAFERRMADQPGGFRYAPGTSRGTTAFPYRLPESDTTDEVERWRREFEVEVVPGRFFDARHGVRIGLAQPPESFDAAFARWREVAAAHRNGATRSVARP